MGYSHKWESTGAIPTEVLQTAFDKIKSFVKWANKDLPNILANELGEKNTSPTIGNEYVGFNGIEENRNESMEFLNDWNGKKSWCKTSEKPYDDIVVASLCLYKHYLKKHLVFKSDGDRYKLRAGYELYVLYCHRKNIPVEALNIILEDIKDGYAITDVN
jgi:hypothetical protein